MDCGKCLYPNQNWGDVMEPPITLGPSILKSASIGSPKQIYTNRITYLHSRLWRCRYVQWIANFFAYAKAIPSFFSNMGLEIWRRQNKSCLPWSKNWWDMSPRDRRPYAMVSVSGDIDTVSIKAAQLSRVPLPTRWKTILSRLRRGRYR